MIVRVRPATAGEVARFPALETAADAVLYVNTDTAAEHATRAARADTTYLAIEREGAFAGFAILVLDPDGQSVELKRLVVAQKNRGTGQAALQAIVRHVEEQTERSRIWLDVAKNNERALHVYEKLGFVPCAKPASAPSPRDPVHYFARPIQR